MPAHDSPSLLLAWLSLGCCALAVLSTPVVMAVIELQRAPLGTWLSGFWVVHTLLVMLALGLALLSRDRTPRAMPVGLALGASGVLALSTFLSWAGRAITLILKF